jgi:hypothetical protein
LRVVIVLIDRRQEPVTRDVTRCTACLCLLS